MGYIAIALIKCFALLGLRQAQAIGRLIGRLIQMRRNRSREVARVNLALTYPELSADERQHMLTETLLQNGMTAAEMGPMWGYSPDKTLALVQDVFQQNLLDQALANERPLLILVPHLGNWEIMNHFLCQHTPLMAMYRPAKMASFNRWMKQRRSKTGLTLVPTRRHGIEQLFQQLHQGGAVAVLPDQEPKVQFGVHVPFMGVATLTPTLPYKLIQETGAQVIVGFAERLANGEGFDIHFMAPSQDIYSDDEIIATTAMNEVIERCVRLAPSQYQWTYKRFKRTADGSTNPYQLAKVP